MFKFKEHESFSSWNFVIISTFILLSIETWLNHKIYDAFAEAIKARITITIDETYNDVHFVVFPSRQSEHSVCHKNTEQKKELSKEDESVHKVDGIMIMNEANKYKNRKE